MIDRIISLLISLCLAFLVWMYARSRDQDTLDNVPVPVRINLAPGLAEQYDLDVPEPCHVPASFAGPPSRLRELRSHIHQGELRVDITLSVPENLQNEGRYVDTVRVEAGDIPVPSGVTPMVVEGRNHIPVTLYRLVERRLPVRFNHLLEDRIAETTIEPATVMVRGPKEILDRVHSLPTQPYGRAAGNDSLVSKETVSEALIPLVRELEGRPIRTTPPSVLVRFTLRPKQRIYELADVPVHFLCPPNFALRPQFADERAGKVSLKVQGPDGEAPPAVAAYVDLTGRKFEAGLYADEPLRLQLPKDFHLAQNQPRSASFRLSPVDPPVKERDLGERGVLPRP